MRSIVNIAGFSNHFISEDGRVFKKKNDALVVLSPEKTRLGYMRIRIRCDGKIQRSLVHRLVADAFMPKPDLATEINHIDGNKGNNSVSNLEWSNRSKNLIHAFRSGLATGLKGDRNPASKLCEDQVREIKRILRETPMYLGMVRDIAKKYGVVPEAISAIKHGKNWRHIK
jgi:HNH endonuclease